MALDNGSSASDAKTKGKGPATVPSSGMVPPSSSSASESESDADNDGLKAQLPTNNAGESTKSLAVDKRQSFIDRFDIAVTEVLQKGKSSLALHTPQKVESNFRIFRQWSSEKLKPDGSSSPSIGDTPVHVTTQPEVDEAAQEVLEMQAYFDEVGGMLEKQASQLRSLNETEASMALFFQQKGYQEKVEEISTMSVDIGKTFSENVKLRAAQLSATESLFEFVRTFKDKAIADSIETIRKQELARLEFDAFAHKLMLLRRTVSLSGSTLLGKELPPSLDLTPVEKEYEHAKTQFLNVKNKYQNLSTAVIDKAVLLEMKRDVDFRLQLERVWRLSNQD
ncbi:hypothetical protein HDU83_006157 [Entophlyctis luteolus]|nr:hypothetical protein HDU82_005565 [Entophlyctis luteolus]KAJ3353952.1 hypothetical protein HDU83_006157 [Entophlyctis luteolus]